MSGTAVDTKVLEEAVQLASRAPSLHNSQPWNWVAEGHTLQLFADPDRVIRSTDSSGREALISCGVILDHLRAAMAVAGWTTVTERFPNPNNFQHVAALTFTPLEFVTDGHRRRADAILARRTDRLPFAAPSGWESLEALLRRSVDADHLRLDVIADEVRSQLAEASQLTESLRLYDSSYHAELQWWTDDFTGQGVPRSSLVSATESDRVDVGRAFPVVEQQRDRRVDLDEDQAKVLVLSTYDETRDSILRCGEALSGRRCTTIRQRPSQ